MAFHLMRRLPVAVFAVGLALLVAPAAAFAAPPAPDVPELADTVNDFAHIIDASNRAAIDQLSRALKAATGDVVVVATVPTIEPFGDIREYANALFANHGKGIGEKGKDNGLLVVVAVKEHRVWNEVGYGLEAWITDGFAGETSREIMTPAFREGRYGDGLRDGVARMVGRIAEGRGVKLEGVPAPAARRREGGSSTSFNTIFWIFVAILIISRIAGGPGRRNRFWGGGPWSGWSSGVGGFGGGGGGGFGGGFGGFGGGSSGGGGGGSSW